MAKKKKAEEENFTITNQMKKAAENYLPRIHWGNKKKVVVSMAVASNAVVGGEMFTEECLQGILKKRFTSIPVNIGFDSEAVVGQCKPESIIDKDGHRALVCSGAIIAPDKLIEKLGNKSFVPTISYKILKSHRVGKVFAVDSIEIDSVSLVDKKQASDDLCDVLSITKDKEIKNRLVE